MNNNNWKINPPLPDLVYDFSKIEEPQTKEQVAAYYNSKEIVALRKHICEIGKRMWQKDFVDGNGGNISIRISKNLVLCTPTLISKGFMTVEDICIVDMEGNQKHGYRPSTSEIKTHLAVMKHNPNALACIHGHPPYLTSYAVSGIVPPSGIISEADIFLGKIVSSPYRHPGSTEMQELMANYAHDQCILWQNHGAFVQSDNLEDAYWKLENAEAVAKTVSLTSLHKQPLTRIPEDGIKKLVELRLALGMEDKRENLEGEDLYNTNTFANQKIVSVGE